MECKAVSVTHSCSQYIWLWFWYSYVSLVYDYKLQDKTLRHLTLAEWTLKKTLTTLLVSSAQVTS